MAADSTAGDTSPLEEAEEDMDRCAGCRQRITDRFMLQIRDEAWHEGCAVCKECGTSLQGSCFLRNGILLCRVHYAKLYGARCARCAQPIASNDLIMRALSHLFHARCFGCMTCDRQLLKGDRYVLRGGLPLCRIDFEREMAADSSSPFEEEEEEVEDSDSESGSFPDGRPGCKRPRTVLSAPQRRRFKAIFEVDAKPNRQVREALSLETGLSMRVVQVWFQNQRAKVKKNARRGLTSSAEERVESLPATELTFESREIVGPAAVF